MGEAVSKVGIISCSGEEIAEGTIARQAVRRVLEALRPHHTVTLCLPLFLAGEEGERRFAREHPTVTVDGCSKLCAKRGTGKYSGQVNASLVVGEILGDRAKQCHRSIRDADKSDEEAVWIVAEQIAAAVDQFIGTRTAGAEAAAGSSAACCACGSPSAEAMLEIDGKRVSVAGLPLIFQYLQKKGLAPDQGSADKLLETVKVYHAIEAEHEEAYRTALVAAYCEYCQKSGS